MLVQRFANGMLLVQDGEGSIVLWCIIKGSLAFFAGSLPPLRRAPRMMTERLRTRAHRASSEPLNFDEAEQFRLESNYRKSSLPRVEEEAYQCS